MLAWLEPDMCFRKLVPGERSPMSFRSASTSRSRWYTSVSRKRCTNVRKKWNGSTMQTPAYRLENGSLPIDMNTRPCWFVLLRLLSIPHSGLWVRVRWLSSFPRAPFSAVLGYWWQRSCTDFASSSSSQCKSWTGGIRDRRFASCIHLKCAWHRCAHPSGDTGLG
jgi:hypothetical protein